MTKKKITAVLLSGALLFSLTGCSEMLEKGSERNKKHKEYIEAIEDIGFNKHKNNNKKDIKKGAYQEINSSSGIEDFFDDLKFEEPDAKDIRKLTIALRKEGNSQFVSFLAEFKEEDEAEDYFEEMCDFYIDLSNEYDNIYGVEVGIDSDDDYLYLAATDSNDGELNIVIILDEYNIYYICGSIYDGDDYEYIELVADLCDSLGFDNPEDYL